MLAVTYNELEEYWYPKIWLLRFEFCQFGRLCLNYVNHLYNRRTRVIRNCKPLSLLKVYLSFLLNLDFLFHMFFLARYCKLLEENSFRGRTADFFYMLLFGATVLTGIVLVGGMIPYISESFAKILFLSNSLTFMMVYVWSKQNPFIHMSFLGIFTFTAAYLPWVLLGFSVLVALYDLVLLHFHADVI
ncbi:hypothetical protein MKW94_016845, partial [Papaver nudicaule]|nr:hypothetical protein [Papaver nudicaule]